VIVYSDRCRVYNQKRFNDIVGKMVCSVNQGLMGHAGQTRAWRRRLRDRARRTSQWGEGLDRTPGAEPALRLRAAPRPGDSNGNPV
jgi:hypothetical protein